MGRQGLNNHITYVRAFHWLINSNNDLGLQDICDIDFHTDASRLVAHWTGFAHPHLAVTYKISVGTTMGGDDVTSPTDVGTSTSFVITGLPLTAFQVCFQILFVNSISVAEQKGGYKFQDVLYCPFARISRHKLVPDCNIQYVTLIQIYGDSV